MDNNNNNSSSNHELIISELNTTIDLTDEQIQFYKDNGYIHLKNIFSKELLDYYGKEITEKVIELNTLKKPMEERDTYEKAFLQVINLWKHSTIVEEFIFGKKLAKLATDLLEIDGVRLYHDQALYKEPSGGSTPWHVDQYYWPLSSDKTVTAWVPLQRTDIDLGPLGFSPTSHKHEFARDIQISDESEKQITDYIGNNGLGIVCDPFDLGDVSFHSGWTAHFAKPNQGNEPRRIMTIIFMDENMRLIEPEHDNHVLDRDAFAPGINVGDIINSPVNPVLYSSSLSS